MARNRYTRAVREHKQSRRRRQEKESLAVGRRLRCQEAGPPEVSPIDKARERRSIRLEQKQRHKAKRRGDGADADQT